MIEYIWDGDCFMPLPRFERACDKFVIGQRYRLEVIEQRSHASHAHFFAAVADAWNNLPDDLADELPSPEHLRAWGLVKAGYADKTVVKCATDDDAARLVALTRAAEKIRIVEITEGRIVTIWTPHSQSMRAMGKAQFAKSKEGVLDAIAQLINVDAGDLGKAA